MFYFRLSIILVYCFHFHVAFGEPFCSEAKFRDGKVLARLAVLARQSRLHGEFSARLASRTEILLCNREVDF